MKRTIIIPAAGLASRMKPLSKGISKAMIPVNGRPLISYIIEHLNVNGGFDEMIIVENELGDIREFVSRVYPNLNITCVIQEKKLGPLHAIEIGWEKSKIMDSAITIWLGDTICLDKFDWSKDFVSVHSVPDPHRWCLIDDKGKLYDKPDEPVPTDKALIGVYHFVNRVDFNLALKDGMNKPTHKNEYQIAGLLDSYQSLQRYPFALVNSDEWYDCGELTTYYESKAKLLKRTARSFNKIDVDIFYGTVTKSATDSEKKHKIELEKKWFKSLSEIQSIFVPRIFASCHGELMMSLEPGTALNEVLVYDNLRNDVWHQIIRKILNIHHNVFFTQGLVKTSDIQKICFESYFVKNSERMQEITNTFGHPEVREFVENVSLELCKKPKWTLCLHGDSHLGNILYDPYSGNIRFVDPRGSFGSSEGIQGDLRYDMGKLLQDFYGGYSMIMADRYTLNIFEKEEVEPTKHVTIDWVGDSESLSDFLIVELLGYGYDVELLMKLAIVLLVTAIPFHADSPKRQSALFYRSLDLINELKTDKYVFVR